MLREVWWLLNCTSETRLLRIRRELDSLALISTYYTWPLVSPTQIPTNAAPLIGSGNVIIVKALIEGVSVSSALMPMVYNYSTEPSYALIVPLPSFLLSLDIVATLSLAIFVKEVSTFYVALVS